MIWEHKTFFQDIPNEELRYNISENSHNQEILLGEYF